MSNPVVARLIGKELSLNRPLILGATFTGLLALGICMLGRIGSAAGGIMFVTVLIAYSVTLPMLAVHGERKDKSQLFMLSLPVSRGEYIRAKVLGVSLSFFAPWAVLLVAAITLILATPIPDGMLVFTVLVMMFALVDFFVIVCSALLAGSEGVMTIIIIVTNMCVTFFMVGVTNLTHIGGDLSIDAVNWDTLALTIVGLEIGAVLVSFALLFWVTGREPEVI